MHVMYYADALMRERAAMYPRHRLDGLGDAIYGVSMTLLVLDIRIPDGANVVDNAGFAALLGALWPHMLPYLISFVVLSSGWLAAIRVPHRGAQAGAAYVRWWRRHLLLVTLMPFSTMLVARFASVPLVAAVYAANGGLMALCAWRMMEAGEAENAAVMAEHRTRLIQIVALSVGAVALSPWLGAKALLLYALRGLPLRRIRQRVHSAEE